MKIAIVGTVGLPAQYGGWETLVENLVKFHDATNRTEEITVYCTKHTYDGTVERFMTAQLEYSRFNANGSQSIIYDIVTMTHAVWTKADVILILGVSGAIFLPVLKRFTKARIITNIDGIEWRREKWKGLIKRFLKTSERIAIAYSDTVLADNQGIADYVLKTYGQTVGVIAYGGDHAVVVPSTDDVIDLPNLPRDYALALCRIEPENNVHIILEAFAQIDHPLVFVGNWSNSAYGAELKARWHNAPQLHLLDPIYDPTTLYHIRKNAKLYVHGHSAGGTNPSLVEMMHFAQPIIAYNCVFNRYTTDNKAIYFNDTKDLLEILTAHDRIPCNMSKTLNDIARRSYTWDKIGDAYFKVMIG